MLLFDNIMDLIETVFNPLYPAVSTSNPMISLCNIFIFGIAFGLISLFLKLISSIKQAGLFG